MAGWSAMGNAMSRSSSDRQTDTDYFGAQDRQWMNDFCVRELDEMAAQLRGAGIEVIVDETEYPNGRFARRYDPQGNAIELWEPA